MPDLDTDSLLTKAQEGDSQAQQQLLTRHQERLRRMILTYLDPRISARVDPSDVLQVALTNASAKMPNYLEHRPLPFYPWLRQIVRDELIRVHRQHVQAQRRSIRCERQLGAEISDASAMQLADYLVSREETPSQNVQLQELQNQVKIALTQLPDSDRELLLMRCIEQLSIDEIVSILEISVSAARSRLTRAMQNLARKLEERRHDL